MSFSLSGAHFPRVERPYRLPTCISRLEAQRGPQRDGGAAHRRGHGFASAAAAASFPAAPRSRPAASQPERATRARRACPAALRGNPTREEPPSGPPEAVTSGVAAAWPQRSVRIPRESRGSGGRPALCPYDVEALCPPGGVLHVPSAPALCRAPFARRGYCSQHRLLPSPSARPGGGSRAAASDTRARRCWAPRGGRQGGRAGGGPPLSTGRAGKTP